LAMAVSDTMASFAHSRNSNHTSTQRSTTMAASTKRLGSAQHVLFVAFLVLFATVQFSSLINVTSVRQTMEITASVHPAVWDHALRLRRNATSPTAIPCADTLGKNGTWIQDWYFAEHYGQYKTPLVIPPGPHARRTWGEFQPSDDAPFRWEASWRWQDYASDDCQIDYTVSPDKLCQALYSLQVTRVLFFGDSLSQSMAKSLLNKMGVQHVITKPNPSNTTDSYELQCKILNIDVQILLAKEGGGHGSRSNPARLNFFFSNETRNFITSNRGRTLAVLNIGAHYHALYEYKEDFHILLDTIDSFQRPNDLVFFRTTVPGHKGCKPVNARRFNWTRGLRQVPLKHFDEYISTSQYAWDLFFDYNEHTKRTLAERTLKPHIHLLDVVNMTILRQDGHVGGTDCLHYYSPGPVDWWNHLLYTFLEKLALSKTLVAAAADDIR